MSAGLSSRAEPASMIRWEQLQKPGLARLHGAARSECRQRSRCGARALVMEDRRLKRLRGWRKPIGHRTIWLDARRSV